MTNEAELQDLMLMAAKGGSDVQHELLEMQRKAKGQSTANHYKVLGVPASASAADIKAAYRCADDLPMICPISITSALHTVVWRNLQL